MEIQTTRCPECGAVLEKVVTESGGERFEEFVASLARAHTDIQGRLQTIGVALRKQDTDLAVASVRDLKDVLDRHVVDEEARILKVLIDARGREGAQDAIRTMQQHRSVHRLVNEMLNALPTSTEEASQKHAELVKILREHFEAEERRVFPAALEAHANPRHEPASRKI